MGSDTERLRDALQKLVSNVDTLVESPSDRAAKVWGILRTQDVTDWDVVCFAVEALGFLSETFPWLKDDTKKLARLVYEAHYLAAQYTTAGSFVRGKPEGNSEGTVQSSSASEGSSTQPSDAIHLRDNQGGAREESKPRETGDGGSSGSGSNS